MKLQNLIIIFIVIIIPITSIFTFYLNLETKTIILQTDYDAKLIEATKEAVNAYEINTTEWNNEFSLLANAKRQDLLSTVNVFTGSLADKLRIGGSSRERILDYIPAIVFTMYDGYYIYAPTYVPQTITDNNGVQLFYYNTAGYEGTKITAKATQNIKGEIVAGAPIYFANDGQGTSGTYNGEAIYYTTDITKAKKTYKHVLKTFVPYTASYGEYTINYTLDNYVRIYGEDIAREGYIFNGFGTLNKIELSVNTISGIKYNGKTIGTEILTENIPIRSNINQDVVIKNYPYIYNSNNDKRYYDESTGKFFTINKNYIRVDLPNTEIGTNMAEYKKVVVCTNATTGKYIELYQLLNGSNDNWYYIDETTKEYKLSPFSISIEKKADCSAINYYVENNYFNKWLRGSSGLGLSETNIQDILNAKTNSIINNINENLKLSFANYKANSGIDYILPELSVVDWTQALSNISMITFFQGKNIGLKIYNNYVVVTSTNNNEYVGEDTLYYINSNDPYYHNYACNKIVGSSITGIYRNTEFKVKSYDYIIKTGLGLENEYSKYYYRHLNINASGTHYAEQECFDCIVNRNNLENDIDIYNQKHYTALARERYKQMQRMLLTRNNHN